MNLEEWKIQAQETMDNLITGEFTRENAILMATSLNILSYEKLLTIYDIVTKIDNKPTENTTINECVDYIPSSQIDEIMQEKLKYFVNYMQEKGLEQTTGATLHKEYAIKELKDMLKCDENIANMLYTSANNDEKVLIKQSYTNMLEMMS